MARTYFQVYFSYEEPLKSLTYEQIGRLFMAMFQYEKTKEKPELDPVSDMAFCFIRSQMERDQQAYDEKCERNSQNGAKGGRPRKSEKSERFSEKRTLTTASDGSERGKNNKKPTGKKDTPNPLTCNVRGPLMAWVTLSNSVKCF